MANEKVEGFWTRITDNLVFKFLLRAIDLLIVAFIGGSLLGAWVAIDAGKWQYVGNIAQFAGAVGTAGLLRVTYSYTRSTKNLVRESKRERNEERKRRERERQREQNTLRQGLLKEIQSVNFVDDSEEAPLEPFQVGQLRRIVPTEVYEGNTDKIGRLTDGEVREVVEYYSLAYHLEDLLHAYRIANTDNSWKDFFSSSEGTEFVSAVSNRQKQLKKAQKEAVKVLKESLDNESSTSRD